MIRSMDMVSSHGLMADTIKGIGKRVNNMVRE